jgi:hypothetical protein
MLLLSPVFGCGRWIAEGKAKVQTITSIGGQKFKVRAVCASQSFACVRAVHGHCIQA